MEIGHAPSFTTMAPFYTLLWNGYDYGKQVDFITDCLALKPGSTILDLGCGPGQQLRLLAEKGYRTIGRDNSPEMLALARVLAPAADLSIGTLCDPEVETTVDAVVCLHSTFSCLVSDGEVRASLSAVRNVLKPGGVLFMDLNYYPDPGNPPTGEFTMESRVGAMKYVRRTRARRAGPGVHELDITHLVYIGDRLAMEVGNDVHQMRIWEPAGISAVIVDCGFEEPRLFADYSTLPADQARWSFEIVAKRSNQGECTVR